MENDFIIHYNVEFRDFRQRPLRASFYIVLKLEITPEGKKKERKRKRERERERERKKESERKKQRERERERERVQRE